jgi:hypothetical protein
MILIISISYFCVIPDIFLKSKKNGGKANTKIEARVEIQTPTTYKNQLRNNIFLVEYFHFNDIQLG